MDLFRDIHIDFMKYRKFWVVVSLALVVVGIFSIFVHGKLNVGIDFAGGTQLTLKFREQPDVDRLRNILAEAGLADAQLQRFGEEGANEVMIKTPLADAEPETAEGTEEGDVMAEAPETTDAVEEGRRDEVVAALDAIYNVEVSGIDVNQVGANQIGGILVAEDPLGLRDPNADDFAVADMEARYQALAESILERRRELGLFSTWDDLSGIDDVPPEVVETLQSEGHLSQFAVLAVENVGPTIGEELRKRGILAVVLSMFGMLFYIWVRFELRFGIGALMAIVHDVLVCLGIYALMGFEFNLTTIAAFLTLVGYSVNDTVVVFDRVRENLRKSRRQPLIDVMNESINQTLARTVLTSSTTLLAVATLLVYGGDVLRGFAFVLTIGVVVGTYSSIYIASPFALLWDQLFGAEAKMRRRKAARAA